MIDWKFPFVLAVTVDILGRVDRRVRGDVGLVALGDDVDVERCADSDVVAAADRAGPVPDRHRLGRRDGHAFVGIGRRVTGRADQRIDQCSTVDIRIRCLM